MHVDAENPHAASLAAVTVRLREAVRKAGGNEAVSLRSGIPLRTLSAYLAGGEIKLSKLLDLAQACGVEVDWLLHGMTPGSQKARNSAGSAERQAPLRAAVIDTHWLAKAIEIVEALGGKELPVRERAARIARSYEMLVAPEDDLAPLPQLPGKRP